MDEISAIGAVNGGQQLTAEELAQVAKLAARDREVRAHEAQHLAVAGSLASGVQYIYELGPDGKLYAVGGRVRIVVLPGATPEETLARARQLRAAAGAPADPSGQDLAVAAQASRMEARALQQIAEQRAAEAQRAPAGHVPVSLRGFDRTA